MLRFLLHIGFIFFIIFPSIETFSATIFSDNFDAHPDTCRVGGDVPSGWSSWYEDGPVTATEAGTTHYAGEVSSPGRGAGGKSLKAWRYNGYWGGYAGALFYSFPPSPGYSHIFVRYYQKIPAAFNCMDESFKAWRFNTSSGSGEIYLDWINCINDCRENGVWAIYDGGTDWTVVLNNADLKAIWDDNWHCIEWEINTASGVLRLYIDGAVKYLSTSHIWSATGTFSAMQHFPIGNTYSHDGLWQLSWQAIEVDDLVISTTYVGPGDFVPNPEPMPGPSIHSSGGGGGCFIVTAAFGSAAEPTVKIFKEFRDVLLLNHEIGRALISYYQRVSPPLADYISKHDLAKFLVRICLLPIAGLCWLSLTIGIFYTFALGILMVTMVVKRRALREALRRAIWQSGLD
jgi:hypothetical protein